jgi:hypothetical protein
VIVSHQLLKYWRLALADGQNASPEIDAAKSDHTFQISTEQIKNGQINEELAKSFIKKYQKKHNDDKIDFALIALAPLILQTRLLHVEAKKNAKVPQMAPIWMPAVVHEDGTLSPSPNLKPWINRTCLSPSGLSDFIVGEIDELDRFLEKQEPREHTSWKDVLHYAEKIWKAITGQNLYQSFFEEYVVTENGVVTLHDGAIKSAARLIKLCNDLEEIDDEVVCQSAACSLLLKQGNKAEAIDKTTVKSAQSHLGYIGKDFDLSPSQREALASSTALQDEQVLAINGPPGTGKTTLIQSIIATGVVKAALEKDRPFIALASSTNNQAITNLIDSLKEAATPYEDDVLSYRWVPDVGSLGLYFPSASAFAKTDTNKYLCCLRQGRSWSGFPEQVENKSFVEKAKETMLRNAAVFFKTDTINIDELSDKLHERLRESYAIFLDYMQLPENLGACEKQYLSRGFKNFDEWSRAARIAREECLQQKNINEELYKKEEAQQKRKGDEVRQLRRKVLAQFDGALIFENGFSMGALFDALFSFLPAAKRKKVRYVAHLLECQGYHQEADDLYVTGSDIKDVEAALARIIHKVESEVAPEGIQKAVDLAQSRFEKADAELEQVNIEIQKWNNLWEQAANDLKRFADLTEDPNAQQWSLEQLKTDFEKSVFGLQEIADRFMRRRMFLLALRYWECRWLKEVENCLKETDKEKQSESKKAMEQRYKRYAMLTPCFVSTFYSAPNIPLAKTSIIQDGKKSFPTIPMIGFFDLLIVDEAGQVSPEIGGPVFTLAKKAIVVGDTKQIEPVVTLDHHVDIGNLIQLGLDEEYDLLYGKGFMATSGSVMEMAQHVSAYTRSDGQGMFLAEHRRCYNEIIEYCNNFYDGQLQPLRGAAADNNLYPPMGYAHVRGKAKKVSGSWSNALEADALADWLARNRQVIEEKYGKALHKVIGVVTPFSGQVKLVRQALKEKGIETNPKKANAVTVGTVHSLQGAERNIVIFSTVYDKYSDVKHYFFDRGPSMLNVAVSRAKDSFLVFGDMEAFSAGDYTPSQKLMKILFASPENEIKDVISAQEFIQFSDVERIETLDKHREILKYVLEMARQKVLIVSPFLSENAIHIDAVPELIEAATQRGVEVCIVTCKDNIADYAYAVAALNILSRTRAKLLNLPKIHNKTLAMDDHIIIEGSFNWLSASRRNGNKEISLAYRGTKTKAFIQRAWEDIGVGV